jgi:transcriptional regulator with XRE-family HTH domain
MARELTPLGAYLLDRMRVAGIERQAEFAEKASLSPATVSRLMYGVVAPDIRTLERLAAVLGVPLAEVVQAQAGGEPTDLVHAGGPIHVLAAEIARLLGPESPIDAHERELLTELLVRVLAPYRKA